MEQKQQRGGAYLIFSALKRVKGRRLFPLSAMMQIQKRGRAYLIFRVLKRVKERNLF